jgi:hypothetical protein
MGSVGDEGDALPGEVRAGGAGDQEEGGGADGEAGEDRLPGDPGRPGADLGPGVGEEAFGPGELGGEDAEADEDDEPAGAGQRDQQQAEGDDGGAGDGNQGAVDDERGRVAAEVVTEAEAVGDLVQQPWFVPVWRGLAVLLPRGPVRAEPVRLAGRSGRADRAGGLGRAFAGQGTLAGVGASGWLRGPPLAWSAWSGGSPAARS